MRKRHWSGMAAAVTALFAAGGAGSSDFNPLFLLPASERDDLLHWAGWVADSNTAVARSSGITTFRGWRPRRPGHAQAVTWADCIHYYRPDRPRTETREEQECTVTHPRVVFDNLLKIDEFLAVRLTLEDIANREVYQFMADRQKATTGRVSRVSYEETEKRYSRFLRRRGLQPRSRRPWDP